MRIVGKTDTGLVRKTNQDDFACGIFPDGNAWAVVCDGMGGVNGGSVASSKAVSIIAECIQKGYDGNMDMAVIKRLISDAVIESNKNVYETALNEPSLFGMGTTVIVCIASPRSAYVAHAGDSRAYIAGKNGIILLTRDHSIVQEMLESGKLNPEEAANHPQRNIITRALGVGEELVIDFCETTFADGATLLICTDGLTNVVEQSDILKIIRSETDDPAGALIAAANQNGGTDNITVVLVDK